MAAISEALSLLGFSMVFGKRRFRSLESFRSLFEIGVGPFLVLLGPSWGFLVALFGVSWALRGLLLSSVWGRVWCLLVRWWRLGCVLGVLSSIFRVVEAQ